MEEVNNFDWNLFWLAFGAIGGTIGALATAAAVIVALWQTKYNNKKKVKLNFSANVQIPSNNGFINHFIMLNVSNIGNRAVKIEKWGFLINKYTFIIAEPISIVDGQVKSQTRELLNIDNSISLLFYKEKFLKLLTENKDKLLKDTTIYFYITDGVGERHKIKIKEKVEDFIPMNNKDKT